LNFHLKLQNEHFPNVQEVREQQEKVVRYKFRDRAQPGDNLSAADMEATAGYDEKVKRLATEYS
jgi:hypothetical protein